MMLHLNVTLIVQAAPDAAVKDFCATVAKCLARRNSNTSFHQQLNPFKTRGGGVFSDAVAMEIVQV